MIHSFILLAVLAGQIGTSTQTPSKDLDESEIVELQKYYRKTAAEYELSHGESFENKLKLWERPLQSYVNPASTYMTHGELFVWTLNGRPEACGILWSKRFGNSRFAIHSFHSLSLSLLQAVRHDSVFWSPKRSGIEPIEVIDAKEPAERPQLRLAQMRSMSRDFSALNHRGEETRNLRLHPQPIFRVDTQERELDGAMFIWFEDWDPELIMLFEIRKSAQSSKWHVVFARFSNLMITVNHKDKEIWRFSPSEAEPPLGTPRSAYNSLHNVEKVPLGSEKPK